MPVIAPVRAGNSKQGSASSLFSWGTETAHPAAASARLGEPTGFTLIELVVVLAIAATVAVVMVPKLSNEAFLVGTQADRLANDIRYVQSLAMTQGQRYVLDLGAGPPSARRRNSSHWRRFRVARPGKTCSCANTRRDPLS